MNLLLTTHNLYIHYVCQVTKVFVQLVDLLRWTLANPDYSHFSAYLVQILTRIL